MRNSTVLYTCNNSGMHDVSHANKFGIVVYDWSNAKAIWANAHPMSSQELITKQAEMVYAQDPGLPGYAPRVWAYRNTIKALNWYSSVREKLDDPKCEFRTSTTFIDCFESSDSISSSSLPIICPRDVPLHELRLLAGLQGPLLWVPRADV
jgi:hypothetical protein